MWKKLNIVKLGIVAVVAVGIALAPKAPAAASKAPQQSNGQVQGTIVVHQHETCPYCCCAKKKDYSACADGCESMGRLDNKPSLAVPPLPKQLQKSNDPGVVGYRNSLASTIKEGNRRFELAMNISRGLCTASCAYMDMRTTKSDGGSCEHDH